VRNVTKSVCLFTAFLVLAAPVMACTVPLHEMDAEEQACCLQMADQCGGTQMSESHSCCTKTPRVDQAALKTTGKYSLPILDLATVGDLSQTVPNLTTHALPRQRDSVDSPSPPGSISVLRI
jgi:hypothetical protein